MEFTSPQHNDQPTQKLTSAEEIISRIQVLTEAALEAAQPLETEPTRGKLFELFAVASASGLTSEGQPLCPDELTRALGQRWGLDQSAQQSIAAQQKLSDGDLAKMRALWATLRLWMEWDYAWSRWDEFHGSTTPKQPR